MISRFVNKKFRDINEINLYMSKHPKYIVKEQYEYDGYICIKFKAQ